MSGTKNLAYFRSDLETVRSVNKRREEEPADGRDAVRRKPVDARRIHRRVAKTGT